MLKTRTELMNLLIEEFKLQTYLEIGLQNKKSNFDKINIKDNFKVSVDPDINANATFQFTSDEFFKKNRITPLVFTFDLIFIDGLHHANQVKKDFENSMEFLNDGGFIVLHDCNPAEEIYSLVPRQSKLWNGDVYKFASTLKLYSGIKYITADTDHGCCIVRKAKKYNSTFSVQDETINAITWDYFIKNKEHLINLMPAKREIILSIFNK